MLTIEKRLIDLFSRHILKIGFLLMLLTSVIVRWKLLPFVTGDMTSYLWPWTESLRNEGLSALKEGVGNYNIPYLLILALIGNVTVDDEATMYMIKFISILFDYLMAAGVGFLIWEAKKDKAPTKRRQWVFASFAATLLLPMVILNSALWGQCDAIFSCFGVWSVYFLMRERYTDAFVLFGLGLCFKLQMIFLLPVFVILYFVQKKFSIFHFFIPVVLLFLSGLPATMQGASWKVAFEIYFAQTGDQKGLFINYANFPALIQDGRYDYFSTALILLALLVCFAMLAALLLKKQEVRGVDVIGLAAWSVMACVLFLPSMHERYAYTGEVLAVAWAMARPSKRTVIPAAVFTFTGYCCYAHFLFDFLPVPYQYLAIANIAAFLYLSYGLLSAHPAKASQSLEQANAS